MLRNGEVVGYPDRDLLQNTEALIAMMVGREIDQLYTPRQRPAADNGATPLLSVRQLSDGRQLQDLSFDIQPGEIVGVAGLLGAGRDVLVDLLYGLRPAELAITLFMVCCVSVMFFPPRLHSKSGRNQLEGELPE